MLFFVSIGCAADQKARQLAYNTLQNAIRYEQEADKKVEAEKAFYREQWNNIRNAIGYINIKDNSSIDIKKTLLYGRLITNNVHDSRIAAGEILSGPETMVMGATLNYVEEGLKKDRIMYLETIEKRKRLEIDLKKSLAKIELQKNELAAVRKELTTLSSHPKLDYQIKQLYEIGDAVRKELEKKNK